MAIKVVHIKDDPNREGEYIGRGYAGRKKSPLANMYSHIPKANAKYVETRDEAVFKYAKELANWVVGFGPDAVRAELNRLYTIARKGDLTLVCHCAPKRCHGEAIKAVLDAKLATPEIKSHHVIQRWLRATFDYDPVPALGRTKVS